MLCVITTPRSQSSRGVFVFMFLVGFVLSLSPSLIPQLHAEQATSTSRTLDPSRTGASSESSFFRFGGPRSTGLNVDVGLELAELMQNRFRDLGPSNYTFLVGQRLWQENLQWLGWRVVSMRVDLSNEHLRDTAVVCCIEGNRDNLVGKLRVHRLYAEYYPGSMDIGFIASLGEYAFSLQPVISAGIGYNRWVTTDTSVSDTHDVAGLSLGGAIRLRAEFLGWFFVELPVVDIFYLTATTRSPAGQAGEAYLNRPENFGMFSWLNTGVRLHW